MFAHENFFKTLDAAESMSPNISASTGVVFAVAPLIIAPTDVAVSSPVFVPDTEVVPVTVNAPLPPFVTDTPLYVLLVRACEVVLSTVTFVSMESVFPLLESPVPAVISPAPENCVKVMAVVPTVTDQVFVQTKPAPALTVPDSTKTNPPENSVEASISTERVSTKSTPTAPATVHL